jgi:hypothetical protein
MSLAPAAAPISSQISPGFLGFVVLFLLAVATYLLIRSMVYHLRKVRYGPSPDDKPGDPDGDGTDPG